MKQKVLMFMVAIFISFSPLLTIAQEAPGAPAAVPPSTPPPAPTNPAPPPSTPPPAPTNPGGRGDLSYNLKNPLAFDSIQDFIVAVLNVIIVIATPIVVIFIVFAGFRYVMARGNAGKVQEATQALTYAIIGGVLIIGAVAIAEIIKNFVTAFGA